MTNTMSRKTAQKGPNNAKQNCFISGMTKLIVHKFKLLMRQAIRQTRRKAHLVLHGEFQIALVGVTSPVTTDLYKLPRNTRLKGPRGTPTSKGMTREIGCVYNLGLAKNSAKGAYELRRGEPLELVVLEKNEGRSAHNQTRKC